MSTRRDAIRQLGAMSAAAWLAGPRSAFAEQGDPPPRLAPGSPNSPERLKLVEAFKIKSDGIEKAFEARSFKSDWTMPYRLFRPTARGRLALVVYLHGSGGLGDDNEKQMGLGNTFGTRVWALPENQKRFPCFVVAPQTDRGWVRYGDPAPGDSVSRPVAGLGDGARVAFEMIEALRHEFPIDPQRIYLTGQSMGGRGVWHMTAQRPTLFAAAVPCCAGPSMEPVLDSVGTPLWVFHGDADTTEPVAMSRDRVAELRKAGGHPLYTEYAGVGHNVWEWAYTEPALIDWVFSRRRAS